MNHFAPEAAHEYLMEHAPRVLRFNPTQDFAVWRSAVSEKLRELVGVMPDRSPLDVRVEYERDEADFRETRFLFTSEPYADVPCHLLVPKAGEGPFPVIICLQGHSTGMHISLGRAKYEGDENSLKGDRDFAIRAVKEGYAALVMEQRSFGERKDARENAANRNCTHASMVALLLGRTMIGERVWDVMRAIDALSAFSDGLDLTRIGCMGNSGGGTITYFASCLEPRIKAAMPSCYVCTFQHSIGTIDHCPDNYLPGILRWFEMGDLAGLIAPRPLVVVAGKDDGIFPIEAVKRTYALIESIYAAAGAEGKCRLVVGDAGHRFYADDAWPVFKQVTGW